MKQNKTVIISTKVTQYAADKFNIAALRMGLNSGYELVQVIVDCLLRYIDNPSEAPEELRRLMTMFDDFAWATHRLRATAAPTAGVHTYIDSAIYFVKQSGKKLMYAVGVEKPYFNDMKADYNVQHLFEKLISICYPKQYKQLQDAARDIGSNNLSDAFIYICDTASKTTDDEATFHELFADNERDITGLQTAVYDKKYKQSKRFNVDGARCNVQQTNTYNAVDELTQLPFAD